MRKFFFIGAFALIIISCNNKASTETTTTTEPTKDTITYAYLPDGHDPDYWMPGDMKNAAIALNAIKGWETGNVDMAVATMADTVLWKADGFSGKVPKDTLRANFIDFWANTSNVKVSMGDYESVISKDKKEEWVTVWYKQVVTDKSGKMDSASVVDDIKIENGKITVMDEKQRKFPVPKK